jgi:hypothetical protein
MTTWSYVNMLFIISNISITFLCKCTKILRPVLLKMYDPDAPAFKLAIHHEACEINIKNIMTRNEHLG